MKIHLRKDASLAKRYRRILSSEWSPLTLKECLSLADTFFNNREDPLGFSRVIGTHERTNNPSYFFDDSRLTTYLKDQSVLLGGKNLPKVPEKAPRRRSAPKLENAKLALEVIYDLSFPLFIKDPEGEGLALAGDIDFLRDLQSLVFILAPEFVLPLLRKNRLKEEVEYLRLVMFTHAVMVWHDNPAHQNHLLSILFDDMGFHEAAVESLYHAFRLTAPEDHDYLIKAQAYWTALVDAEMLDEAKSFALRLLRNSPEHYFDEIKEIIELSFELEAR